MTPRASTGSARAAGQTPGQEDTQEESEELTTAALPAHTRGDAHARHWWAVMD